ncbi:MAG: enoyl-CoA hydratase/isomerase family protein [Chloroflexi bacterium]|nr:enoyl-CoA hydratase/isomerase family protein [Chloroflexota bacterium]
MIAERAAPTSPAETPSARFVPADGTGIARIVIDRPDDAVNSVDVRLLDDLMHAIAAARSARPRGLVIASGKADQFMAGADLSLLRGASQQDAERASRRMQEVLEELAALPFTTVAAINGPALGGGFELALACDRRVMADTPNARVGLTEVRLGLIPAAGGTQRLVRLIGLPRALDLILGARQLTPKRALRAGVVDEVVHPAVLLRATGEVALTGGKASARGGRTAIERAITWLAPLRAVALSQARKRTLAETRGFYPAPLRAIDAVAAGLSRGMAAGLEEESRAFGELATSQTGRNLTSLLVRTLRQRRAAFEGLGAARPVGRVGVVGLGFMGSGIAQSAAVAGMTVRARDRDAAAVAKGISSIRKLTTEAARKGAIERREATRVTGRVSGGPDLAGFRHADLVIEAVFEEIGAKRAVISELEAVLRADAVIASNTSALPIGEIARGARHPERIVGMHFFSPVHKMPLIEVVRPAGADPDAVATAVATAVAFGKTPIVVGDGPGFYTTRVLSTMIADAFALVGEGVAIEAIDRAMTEFGWPVGPLQLVDEVGLEVAAHAGETIAKARRMDGPGIVASLADEGFRGKARGGGFYLYEGRKRTANPRVYAILGVTPRATTGGIAGRLTTTFVREAQRCLEEGILRSADEGDLGAVLGLGFPPFLGGPFTYARERGIS